MLKALGCIISGLRVVPVAISLAAILTIASNPRSAAAQTALSPPIADECPPVVKVN